MKFLIDQNLPPELAQLIEKHGKTAQHVDFIGLGAADDAEIIRIARQDNWVIVSRDSDFERQAGGADIMIWFQLVWIRLGNCSNEELAAAWTSAWESTLISLERGDPVVEIGKPHAG